MNAVQSDSARLLGLEQILATSRSALGSPGIGDGDAAELMLGSVMIERIRRTTSELERRRTGDIDAIDALTMRLLLVDYVAAVSHLRAVVRITERRLTGASAAIKEGGRRVERALDEASRWASARTP